MNYFYINVKQYGIEYCFKILSNSEECAREHFVKNYRDYNISYDVEFPYEILSVENTLQRFYNRGLTDEMVNKINYIAYRRGHHADDIEVENIFISMMYDIFELDDYDNKKVDKEKIVT